MLGGGVIVTQGGAAQLMESGPHKVTLTLGINNNNNTPSLVNNAGQRRETGADHLEQHT